MVTAWLSLTCRVGESRDRDAEYEALYRDILPELDLGTVAD